MIVEATRIVTTQGQYAGEAGAGYIWGSPDPTGDFSQTTQGRIQGYCEPCRIELLVEGAEIVDAEGFGPLLWLPVAVSEEAFLADEAIALGYARVVEEQP